MCSQSTDTRPPSSGALIAAGSSVSASLVATVRALRGRRVHGVDGYAGRRGHVRLSTLRARPLLRSLHNKPGTALPTERSEHAQHCASVGGSRGGWTLHMLTTVVCLPEQDPTSLLL